MYANSEPIMYMFCPCKSLKCGIVCTGKPCNQWRVCVFAWLSELFGQCNTKVMFLAGPSFLVLIFLSGGSILSDARCPIIKACAMCMLMMQPWRPQSLPNLFERIRVIWFLFVIKYTMF